jgi:hypothetical protein
MAAHRAKRRPRRRSSSGVRHALGGVVLVVVLLFLGQVAYAFAQEERWGGAAITGFVMVGLLLITWLSVRQGPIRASRSVRSRPKRKAG